MEAMVFTCPRGKKNYTSPRKLNKRRLTCIGDVILKHPGKSITNFPRENFDMSGQLRDRLLAWAVYTQQSILSIQLKMLLSHSNLRFWIPGATAGKALPLCTGHMAAAGWGGHGMKGLLLSFKTTSTKAQQSCRQFFPAGGVLTTSKEGAERPRSVCRHSCINPVTRDHPVCSPS